MLTFEKRLSNLENLVNALSKKIDSIKYYQDADTQGVRQSVGEITPYTETKTAYYGEKEITFYNVPESGNITVFFTDYNSDYIVNRVADKVTITFLKPLEISTNVTISIL